MDLGPSPGYPYTAIGFLSNGCTAFLIDTDHIAAAAHCFINDLTGDWKTGLTFFPNYDPSYLNNRAHVPRATVTDGVVVGTRVSTDSFVGDDWGIAGVTNWQDTAGLDLTPLPVFYYYSGLGPISNAGYPRDDYDNPTVSHCGKSPYLKLLDIPANAPPTAPPNLTTGCNIRWIGRRADPDCNITNDDSNGMLSFDCAASGGSSGSPIIQTVNAYGLYWHAAVGLIHGGPNGPDASPYDECENNPGPNVGPSAENFVYAPRWATSLAVNRGDYSLHSTGVFAIDGSDNHVVYRERQGTTYTDPFSTWIDLGSPASGALLLSLAVAQQSNYLPQVFVEQGLFNISSMKYSNGSWGSWFGVSTPGSGWIYDMDVATSAYGDGLLVTQGGSAYYRPAITSSNPGNWELIGSGGFSRITGLYYNGITYAAMLDGNGDIWRSQRYLYNGSWHWDAPTKLARPAGVTWADMDMTWDEYGRGFMVAIPTNPSNADLLYFTPMYGSSIWQWLHFNTRLWTPLTTTSHVAPTLVSITADRWWEDSGTTSPVVFGTDSHGEVYFIEYKRVPPVGWKLDWKTFYNRKIPYCSGNGQSCSSSTCCGGLTCSPGWYCTRPSGYSCVVSADCYSNLCQNGTCT